MARFVLRSHSICLLVAAAGCLSNATARAQLEFNREPIRYAEAAVNDPVARLQQKIDAGQVKLSYDGQRGYLESVLKELGVSPKSQTLVFSKTSFQQRLISPQRPRALYFNDDVYVGYVQRGDVLEFSAVDPQQGAVFYTLRQEKAAKPKFVRDRGNCLTCHASSRTQDVPGHMVRSVYPSESGMPHFGAGTFRTNHASPLSERWGGWYVTGTHGKQRHMGNAISPDRQDAEKLDVEAGANRTDLKELLDTDAYLSPHSDIVALLVLEHQVDMHNLLTRASYTTRTALFQGANMNKILERPATYVSDSTKRRIDNAAEKLVKYMLFSEEAALTDPIRGTSGFADEFAARGPLDRRGRSLRQFDLTRRIFKYPCSYLIYSEAFAALPEQVKSRVYRRLWEVLTGKETDEAYAHLTAQDRQAILEILRDTKQDLPDYWRAGS